MEITVVGAGKSGLEAAKLARRKGHNVLLTESASANKYEKVINELDDLGIIYEFGGHTNYATDFCELMITSPGVPPYSNIIKVALEKSIPIVSELEFAYQFVKKRNKIVAITGTNGKTTTTSLMHFILENAGKKSLALGNIGIPLSAVVEKLSGDEILVIETSSYQLDRIDKFSPDVAMILNITPDHLAYHGTFEQYANAKWKITSNQKKGDLLILPYDDNVLGGSPNKEADRRFFSLKNPMADIYVENETLIIFDHKHLRKEELMLARDIRLPGRHNLYNSMAAVLAARHLEIKNEDIRDALSKFSGVEHRLEFVRKLDNVDYINDSKATNINATWFALSSYKRPLIWLAGGLGDNNNYTPLDEFVKQNVKHIVAIGDEKKAIANHFASFMDCELADTFEDGIKKCREIANSGDIVLFSPACKSFDMFMNYEHRGDTFKAIVNSFI
jgi:UDP-N-acetylmuramoylalanine--D-glutamate ligase